MRPRPTLVTLGFAALFAIIASLSWATAAATTGPWFDLTASLSVYAVAIGLASALAVVLVHHASGRAAALDSSLRRLDRRMALLRATPKKPVDAASVHVVPVPRDAATELGAEVDAFSAEPSMGLVGLEKAGHDTLVPLVRATRPAAPEARAQVLRLLTRDRIALREERAAVWTTAAGPILTSLLFLTIAGPMLPGAGGFATAHFALNTTLVLFLAYGFAPLVAWSVISLALMGPRERPGERRA